MSSAMISSGRPDLNDRFEDRQHRLQVRQLLLVDEDVRVVKLDLHLLGVGDEVGRQIAAVELHAFDDIELELEALGLFDGDHAFLADLFHRLGDLLADFLVAVGGDRAHLSDLPVVGHSLRPTLQIFHHLGDRDVDAALQVHRVGTGGDRLHALADDCLGEDSRGRCAVTGMIVGLSRDGSDHLRAHVLELVLELDFLGDGDAVLGDARCAKALVQNDVAALGSKRHAYGIGDDVHATSNSFTRVARESDVLACHGRNSLFAREPGVPEYP